MREGAEKITDIKRSERESERRKVEGKRKIEYSKKNALFILLQRLHHTFYTKYSPIQGIAYEIDHNRQAVLLGIIVQYSHSIVWVFEFVDVNSRHMWGDIQEQRKIAVVFIQKSHV